jgi:hypothetical protein
MSKRIGEFQGAPVEEMSTANLREKYALCVDWIASSGKIASVRLSNKDKAGIKIIHEIRIEGKNGIVNRTLVALTQALETLKSMEERIESEIKEDIERKQKETGILVIRVPGGLSKENTPEIRLSEYGLKVRRSRYDEQSIFFIVKGTEKEDTAIKPPFKIEIEGEGDFVSVSRGNIRPLVEELTAIFQLPLMRE